MIPQQIQKKKALSQNMNMKPKHLNILLIQKKKQINKAANDDKFPDDYFYLRVGLMSHVYVLGAKRISTFFGFRKLGKHIVLRHQKPDTNGANQQWTLTKEGYIGLKSHPKYVINVKGTSIKDGSHVVLSDSNSVSFARCNFAKWEIISLNKIINSLYCEYYL
ncbi:unnamed protein product [Rhizophagus irregularis]|nr:unnamed protein product [Rhizophagus irregularis]CAB5365165.1 unnamed protein product [Rhizophagus irregularis]